MKEITTKESIKNTTKQSYVRKLTRRNACKCGSDFKSRKARECPFASDVHGKIELCYCCDSCREQCALDI